MKEEMLMKLLEDSHSKANSKTEHMSASLALVIMFAKAYDIPLDFKQLWRLFQQIPQETNPQVVEFRLCWN